MVVLAENSRRGGEVWRESRKVMRNSNIYFVYFLAGHGTLISKNGRV